MIDLYKNETATIKMHRKLNFCFTRQKIKIRAILLFTGILIVFFFLTELARAAKITSIRAGDHKHFTRIVFQSQGPVSFIKPVITNKGKFCMVLSNTVSDLPPQITFEATAQIKVVDLTQKGPDLVADITLSFAFFKVKSYALTSPHRIVLDIYRKPITQKQQPKAAAKRIRSLVQAGNYKEALSILLPFTSEPMKYSNLFSDYLVILFWIGKNDEAVKRFEALPPSFPKRPYLLRNMAKIYYDKKVFSKAASLYTNALKQTPSDQEAQKGLVLSIMNAGDFGKAYELVNKFLAQSHRSLPLALTKAELLMKMGSYREAFKLYDLMSTRKDVDADHIFKIREDLIAALPPVDQKAVLNSLRSQVKKGDRMATLNYMNVLILTRDYQGAIGVFETADIGLDRYPRRFLSWVAWAYFKTGKTEKAKTYYQKILAANPEYIGAKIGLSFCLAASGKEKKALRILDKLLHDDPQNLEARFAVAFAHEQGKRFLSAVKEYDHILKISPKNPIAHKLRRVALSDMGSSSIALDQTGDELPSDPKTFNNIKADKAVDRINWKEPKEAIELLSPLVENFETKRFEFDYIAALAEDNRMEEAVDYYEKLVKQGMHPPPWILEEVAGAYLYMEQPAKALTLYNQALKARPNSFNGRMGKFYTLQELQQWKEAGKVLDKLDKETLPAMGKGRNIQPNWNKLDIALAKGWFLAHENKLKEAEEFFEFLYQKAPGNAGIRSGLAHVYLYRGWPRKALKEFNIVETLEPEHYKAKIGKICALNELALKEAARKNAHQLLSLYPKDKHIQQVVRKLKVEEMRELSIYGFVSREEEGADETHWETRISQPLSLYSKIYGFVLRRRTKDDNLSTKFRRGGLGIDHIFNSTWDLRQQLSVNYNDGDDFGSLTLVNFHANDYLSVSLSYDSFTTDIPLRARVFDIEAEKVAFGATYRESDWRSYHVSLSRQAFSDHNDRDEALFRYEQGLWTKNDWKTRLFLDAYTSRNSRDDTPYFNPERDWSLSATHLIEQTVWNIYDRAFIHRLFLTVGTYKQTGFSDELISSLRYEQGHEFSDTQALTWGIGLSRNVYDGDPVNSYSIDFYYTWRF
jgi:biofilm PGA synthesis protein PgaA